MKKMLILQKYFYSHCIAMIVKIQNHDNMMQMLDY